MLVIDADTHVDPSLETLEIFAGEELRRRWDSLTPYRRQLGDDDHPRTGLSIAPMRYRRPTRRPGPDGVISEPGEAGGHTRQAVSMGKGVIAKSVSDLDAARRLKDMDEEGVDIHILIPGPWSLGVCALDVELVRGLYGCYHRYAEAYCSSDAHRLRSVLLAPAWDAEWAASEIRRLADRPWLAAVSVTLRSGQPIDGPEIDPIWRAMEDVGLPLLYHPFSYEPPYPPGHQEMWGNVVMARSAALPWSAQRLLTYLVLGGLFDEYPTLKVGFAETSAGWLPWWVRRLDMNREYIRTSSTGPRSSAVDYVRAGRVFAGIELYEGAETAKCVERELGPGVAMFSTDYPHPESEWPDSLRKVTSWEDALGSEYLGRILGGNAADLFRL